MRKYLIIGIVAGICGILNAESLTITKSFTTNKTLTPRFITSTIRIESAEKLRNIGELSEKTRSAINTTLNNIIARAKDGTLCKGGGYEIAPIVNYEKGARKTIGQNVKFSLECKFSEDELEAYNRLLGEINAMILQNDLLALPQPKLEHRITNDEVNVAKEEMFAQFLVESLPKIAKNYSNALKKTCFATEITTTDSYSTMPHIMSRAQMEDAVVLASTNAAAPIASEAEVEVNITMKMVCE